TTLFRSDVSFEEHRRFRRTFPTGVTDTNLSTYSAHFFDAQAGETYTLSIMVKPEIDLTLRLNSSGPNTLCKAGVWTRLTYTASNMGTNTRYMGVYGGGFSASKMPWIEYKDAKVEKGNIATDWTPALEDIDEQLNEKAGHEDISNLAEIISDMSAEVNLKAGMGEIQAMEEAFNARVEQEIEDKAQLAQKLSDLE